MVCVCINWSASVAFNADCLSKLKDISSIQAITYTLKIVVSDNWCEIDILLLETISTKYDIAFQIVPFAVTLNDH